MKQQVKQREIQNAILAFCTHYNIPITLYTPSNQKSQSSMRLRDTEQNKQIGVVYFTNPKNLLTFNYQAFQNMSEGHRYLLQTVLTQKLTQHFFPNV